MRGVNTAIVFWEDELYDHVIIGEDNHLDFRRMILLAVFHIQVEDPNNPGQPDPNALPNVIRFSTHENNASTFVSTKDMLIVRDVCDSPPFVRQFEFDFVGDLNNGQRNIVTEIPPDVALTGMERVTNNMQFFEPGFFPLRDRARDLTGTLQEAVAPALNVPY